MASGAGNPPPTGPVSRRRRQPCRLTDGMAVWIGGQPVPNRAVNPAAQIYQEFMHAAPQTLGLPAAEPFPPRADVGDAFPDGAVAG